MNNYPNQQNPRQGSSNYPNQNPNPVPQQNPVQNTVQNPVQNTVQNQGHTPVQNQPDENVYTMGARAYYESAMSNLRTNKAHLKIDESVLKDIDKISTRIANKYGYESNEFRKFAEKVRSYETLQDDVAKLIRATKRRQFIARFITFLCIVAVGIGGYLLLNTNTYYRDPSHYYYIYRQNIFGQKEKVIKEEASSLARYKGKLYFINKKDNYLYCAAIKDLKVDDSDDEEETDPESITKTECVFDEEECMYVEVSEGKLMITTMEEDEYYFNTKTQELEEIED